MRLAARFSAAGLLFGASSSGGVLLCHRHTEQPSPFVVRMISEAQPWSPHQTITCPPKALDIAAGHGRHTQLLLKLGCQVTAVDRDVAELRRMDDARLTVIEADLEVPDEPHIPVPDEAFELVLVTNYLHRPLFPEILRCLAVDGLLLYETFAEGHERYGRPRRREFLLQEGELLQFARQNGLEVIFYEHLDDGSAVRQRICCRKVHVPGVHSPLGPRAPYRNCCGVADKRHDLRTG